MYVIFTWMYYWNELNVLLDKYSVYVLCGQHLNINLNYLNSNIQYKWFIGIKEALCVNTWLM